MFYNFFIVVIESHHDCLSFKNKILVNIILLQGSKKEIGSLYFLTFISYFLCNLIICILKSQTITIIIVRYEL